MEYDIIKLLHLEDYEPLIESIQVTKDENKLNCYISLHRTHQLCPFCGGLELVVHDYRNKTMKHSYSTNTPCFLFIKLEDISVSTVIRSFMSLIHFPPITIKQHIIQDYTF